ncbi:MAG: Flp pilus assembly complex ATPase component TadA [Candidatus Omnitrophica bacterium]|nr:Flp pilus assembly complex ATPase component TadA [Candidatus Omnitrophota bacterium]
MGKNKFPLGQLLIEKKIITQEQLDIALRKQKETGELLGATLLDLGFIDEETVFIPLLAGQLGVDFISFKDLQINPEAIKKLPAKFASHYNIIPCDFKDNVLKIATTQPLDVHLIDELSSVVKSKVKTVLASEKDITEAIRQYYGVGAETIEQMMGSVQQSAVSEKEVAGIEDESEASISKFLNQIIIEAYRDRATDIHIEPYEDELKIRYRIDGILYDAKVPANIKVFKDAINSRIKILSNLNIAEKRVPQDGRFKVRVNDLDIDLRVSFLPTQHGESVVLRVLNSARLYDLEELGFNKDELKIIENILKRPHGIIFLTGPTGSGKTTTLYSFLSKVNTEDKKIITIEDPVEYQLKGITQIQINPKVGLTFAQGLRSMLRHDPDIMMVGEVRDIETAEIAIQVALTGHLVLSTLHTNDAPSGVARLLDMGVEPYLITSTVECLIAQRLVRVICPSCRQSYILPDDVLEEFGEEKGKEVIAYKGKGCESCHFTGYIGRESIYEILVFSEEIRGLVMERATANHIREKAAAQGMKTLLHSGWAKIKKGITTVEEIFRVTKDE